MTSGKGLLNKDGLLAISQDEFHNILYSPSRTIDRDSPPEHQEDLPVIFRIQSSIDQFHIGMNQLFDNVHSHNRKM